MTREGELGAAGPAGETSTLPALTGHRWARRLVVPAVAIVLAAAVDFAARRSLDGPIRLDVGAYSGPLLGEWSAPKRAVFPENVHSSLVSDGVTAFYYRVITERGEMRLPLLNRGPHVDVALRANAEVRSVLRLYVDGQPVGQGLITPGPWQRHETSVQVPPGTNLTLGFALRPVPLVRGDHAERLWMGIDYLELSSDAGFTLAPAQRLTVVAIPLLVLAAALLVGASPAWALLGSGLAGILSVVATRIAPVAVSAAAPRLVPVALLSGLLVYAGLGRVGSLRSVDRRGLAMLVGIGVLCHGAVVFFPNHVPPDLTTHAVRTLDLEHSPMTYQGLLRYGSHLPTVSQDGAAATALFGERALIPYSPLPYFAYYALHWLGLDLGWSMTILTTVLVMGLAPLIWLAAFHVWGRGAAWIATLLYCADLPVWHHVGRAHLPASFGNALGVAAILALVCKGDRLDSPRRVTLAAVVLAAGALGYTSFALLFGLFGLVLFALLLVDARAIPSRGRWGLVAAFSIGGLLAGALYYFHYLPGLLGQLGRLESEAPEIFNPRTFLLFHNESTQSMRIWVLGSWWLIAAGLLAAPFAMRHARAEARPLLLSWLLTWCLFMVLKDPFFFPKLLRWTKEEQFISPLMDLLVAGLVVSLPRPWMRWTAGGVAIVWAFRLVGRDFLLHTNSIVF